MCARCWPKTGHYGGSHLWRKINKKKRATDWRHTLCLNANQRNARKVGLAAQRIDSSWAYGMPMQSRPRSVADRRGRPVATSAVKSFWEINAVIHAVIHAVMLRDRPSEKVPIPISNPNPTQKPKIQKMARTHSQGIGIPATISMKCAH